MNLNLYYFVYHLLNYIFKTDVPCCITCTLKMNLLMLLCIVILYIILILFPNSLSYCPLQSTLKSYLFEFINVEMLYKLDCILFGSLQEEA